MKTCLSSFTAWLWLFTVYGKMSGIILYRIFIGTAFMTKRSSKNITGRKYESKKNLVEHRRELIPINNGPAYGVHMTTLKNSFEQLDRGFDRWGRLLFMTFVLWPGCSNETNEIMKRFRERFSYQFGKLGLSTNDYGFHWCRERTETKTEHYHLAMWINGNKFNRTWTLAPLVRRCWEEIGGRVGAGKKKTKNEMGNTEGADKYERWWLFVNDAQTRLEVFYWLSYLSKSNTKGLKAPQTKEHGMSRLKPLP
jgi:hypothetical protein